MSKKVIADSLAQLQKRSSSKWRFYPSDILPLPVAEMDFPIADPIKFALHDLVERSDTGYLGPIPELKENFAGFASRKWNWNLDPEQVRIACDVGVGVIEVLRTFMSVGDKLMINTPVYNNFFTWINELKLTKVEAPLKREGMHFTLDMAGIEAAYKSGVKAHLLCNPHNPVGTVYTKSELMQIAELADKYDVIVISDEIHAPLTFSDSTFTPFLAASDISKKVGITVTSASKAFNLAGLKCATIVAQDPKLNAMLDTMPESVHLRASLFGAIADAVAYKSCDEWLDGVIATLDENRRLVADLLEAKVPAIKYRIPDCSYLAWLDLSELNLGENPAAHFLEKGKVAFNPGHTYGADYSQFVRLNFGTSPEIITDSIGRILNSL